MLQPGNMICCDIREDKPLFCWRVLWFCCNNHDWFVSHTKFVNLKSEILFSSQRKEPSLRERVPARPPDILKGEDVFRDSFPMVMQALTFSRWERLNWTYTGLCGPYLAAEELLRLTFRTANLRLGPLSSFEGEWWFWLPRSPLNDPLHHSRWIGEESQKASPSHS